MRDTRYPPSSHWIHNYFITNHADFNRISLLATKLGTRLPILVLVIMDLSDQDLCVALMERTMFHVSGFIPF